MKEYTPNNWVIVKIISDEVFYKVLAGWSGGYLNGDSWQLNSGISKIEEDDNYYYFHGYSGSIYKCNKESEGLRMNIAGIYSRLEELHGDSVKMVSVNEINL